MAKTTLDCEWSDCPWVSKEATVKTCLRLLGIHVAANHSSAQTQSRSSSSSTAKPEKAKRPELASEMSDEDWAYFLSRWDDYKLSTSLKGGEIVLQLMECCCEQLRRDHHRTYPKTGVGTVTEETRLSELKQLAVRQKNRMVNRVKLGTLKQDKGEPVRKFYGRVHSLASVSEYTVSCAKCQVLVPYTEPVIMDQVIAGLAEVDIQKDVLSHPDGASMTLEKLLQFVEGKESGQASQGLMSGNLVGEVDRKIKCRYCDSQHPKGRMNCKADGKKCEKCGKMNHLAKACKSRPSNPAEKQSTVAEKQEVKETQQGVSAAWNYPDGNWACRVDITTEPNNEEFNLFKSYENKDFKNYTCDIISHYEQAGLYSDAKEVLNIKNEIGPPTPEILKNKAKNIKRKKKKVGQPALVKTIKEASKYKKKKVGQPTLVSSSSLIVAVMAIMTGSAIMSALPEGSASTAQAAVVTQSGSKLGHHVYNKTRGWMRQASKPKPMMMVQSRVDLPAYAALKLRAPVHPLRIAEGYHLADTGASICLGGRQFMRSLGLYESDLTPCDISVCGADNSSIKVLGAVLVEFKCRESPLLSKQVVYVCEGVAGALLSLEACIDLGLVNANFPQPSSVKSCDAVKQKNEECGCKCPPRADPPTPPDTLPFEPTVMNVPKLEAWIRSKYAASAFNCCECQSLQRIHGPPLTIHMQEGVKPVASHSPIPVPLHWQKKVKAGLDRDEAIGVIERVPPGTPTTWCHRMVVVPKKDNTPRRTVNFQPLNQYSTRQTHHTMSPFHQATSVPAGTKKTVVDAWNGYHSVYLDPKCRDLTTFITPWGRYRYKTTPQGYLAAGDAYTERFDKIISGVENKTKCVDDTLLCSN